MRLKTEKSGIDRIEDVELFVSIVERGSLTAAAVAAGSSVSLVSRRLSDLERSLGVRLVDRSSRMLVLTEHGREFHGRAETILHAVREAEAALRSKADELRGTLRISLPTAVAEIGLLADFISLFSRHPELSIEMHLSDRPVDVIGRGFDAALYLTDAPDRHPGDLILARHPTLLAAAPAYLDRAGRPQTLEDLAAHRTIRAVSSRGKATDWLLIHEDGREQVLPPTGGMFLSSEVRLLYAAAIAGAGIGRVPLGSLARATDARELELVLPQWRFRPVMVAATVRRVGVRSSKVSALLELASGTLRRIEELTIASPLEELFRRQMANATDPTSAETAPPSEPAFPDFKSSIF